MFMSETLQEKWQPVLSHPDLPEITDPYKKAVTSVVLENQERAFNEENGIQSLSEAAPVNSAGGQNGGGIDNCDKIKNLYKLGIDGCVISRSLHLNEINIKDIKVNLNKANFKLRK